MKVCMWIYLVGVLAVTCFGLVAGRDGCPVLDSGSVGNCEEQCSSDADCENHQACCSNGCGHACVNVTRPPGISPKCPPLERESVGPCVEECTSDSQCETGQVCCSNGCGHSCTRPLERTPKPGRCPEVDNRTDSVGVCSEECSGDGDCQGNQKCCSNGCGHACTETDQQADATEGPQVHDGSCPEIAEGSMGVCSEECSSDEDCSENQKCCSNGCGHVCKDPTMKAPSEPKPGYCPVPPSSTMGACSEECSSDEDCNGDQKCCSNGCGHVCKDPSTKVPSEPKPGYCPAPPASTMGVCSEKCSSDEDCSENQKCCSNGCGHVCKDPTMKAPSEPKPGYCPAPPASSMGACSEECSSDEDCKENQKCCSNGCGHVCEDPTMKVPSEPKPGYCPAPPASSMGVCSEECSSDEDCKENQKCCSNGCGHVCMTTTTDQIPQNDGCRLGENFYLDGEIIPTEECSECRCSVGEVKCTIKDDCEERVPFISAVVMPAVFCSVGIVMTCALLLIFARCFLFKPASRKSRYKLMHEIPEFEPDFGAAMKNGNVL